MANKVAMTNDQRTAKMAELRASLEVSVQKYNEAMQGLKFDEASSLDEKITEAIGEYAGIARDYCFQECLDTGDPMMAAVQKLTYPVIGVKDTKKDGINIPVREVVNKDRAIDALKLHKFCGTIGHDPNWPYLVEQLNLRMTLKTAQELGVSEDRMKEINDSFGMSELARQVSMGKTPCSNTQMLKTLTTVVQAMVGEEYKPSSHDVAFLWKVYSKKSKKALTVTCSNNRYLRGYLLEVCNHIVTRRSYDVENREMKIK